MDDDDRDVRAAVRAAGVEPTAATRDAMRASLVAALSGIDEQTARAWSARPNRHNRRRGLLVAAGLAAAAAVTAGALLVVDRDDDSARVVTGGSSPSSAPSSALPTGPPSVAMDDLRGGRWVVVERDGEPWSTSYLPYVEFGTSGLSGAADPFLGGNDGCNWYGAGGSLDGDRLRVAEVASTAMDCGAGVGGVLPQDGDRVSLSDGGRTLDLIGADDRVRLRLSRLESLAAAAPDTLTGRWVLDGGAPGPLEFGSDWSGGLGSCRWGWKLGQALVVSGWPADPYACLDGSEDQASSRLVEMLVGDGPVAARLSDDGTDLYLSDDQFVIRLSRTSGGEGPLAPPRTVDMLAGWPPPPAVVPDLALVPRLLPSEPVPGARDVTRREYADEPATIHDYSQLWLRGGEDAAALLVTTHLGQHPQPPGPGMTEIDVDGWDSAWVTTGPEPQSLVLDDPSGMVTILQAGISGDVAELVPMLERRSEGQPGWDLALSSFVPVHEGWGMGAAARDVTWTGDSAAGTVAELTVMWGTPGPLVNVFTGVVNGSADVTEVGGAPAVTYQVGNISVVAWSPQPDVVAQLALVGSPEDALSLARSVQPVDEGTWTAIRSVELGDGCQSLLC